MRRGSPGDTSCQTCAFNGFKAVTHDIMKRIKITLHIALRLHTVSDLRRNHNTYQIKM